MAAIQDFGGLPVLGLPGSELLKAPESAGLTTFHETFADRAYTSGGHLVSRRFPGAVVHEPKDVAARCARMVLDGTVEAIDGTTVSLPELPVRARRQSGRGVDGQGGPGRADGGRRHPATVRRLEMGAGDQAAASRNESLRMTWHGERAVMLELPDPDLVHRTYHRLRAEALPGVVDLVPGAETLLVRVDPRVVDLARLQDVAGSIAGTVERPVRGPVVEIPVVYDGEDLAEVAQLTGLTCEEVIERHTGPEYVTAFCGFVPGFAYLTGLDPVLRLGRRETPRVRVPAGAVAVADHFSAVYPRVSPGGWHLLGRTQLPMFAEERDPPALPRSPGRWARPPAVRRSGCSLVLRGTPRPCRHCAWATGVSTYH